jgi:putative membrane protein
MKRWSWYYAFLLALFLAVWIWAAIDPLLPDGWLLENYLVFLFVPLIFITGRYLKLSHFSYTLITLFMILHVIGSHYTYAQVPFGFTLQEWFGSSRNMYDRLVHLTFGLLLSYPVREVFVRITKTKGFWGYYFPVELTLAFSALYELIEWGAAAFVNPDAGLAFLGAQGDIWDAQKDMLLAFLGALFTMTLTFFINLWYRTDAISEIKESLKVPDRDRPMGERTLRDLMQRSR